MENSSSPDFLMPMMGGSPLCPPKWGVLGDTCACHSTPRGGLIMFLFLLSPCERFPEV